LNNNNHSNVATAAAGEHLTTTTTTTASAGMMTRRKLEPEDSSYDSDHEALAATRSVDQAPPSHLQQQHPSLLYSSSVSSAWSHEDVSRSDSETLGQEFAEYVTTIRRLGSRDSSPAADRILEAVQENMPPPSVTTKTMTTVSQVQRQLSSSSSSSLAATTTSTTAGDQDITRITQDPSYNSKV
jgi:hypothetical protein